MTTVVNIKSGQPFDVYIGRPMPRAKDARVRAGSIWRNPFRLGIGCNRGDMLVKYERLIRDRLALDPPERKRLLELKGKRLGCWCAPDPCHGDVLVKLINELEAQDEHGGTQGAAPGQA